MSKPRNLLARLRNLMARGPAPLTEIVRLVASELAADVCSIYAMKPGDTLELAATEGLRPEAVGRTRLRVGEGIVGLVAATASATNVTLSEQGWKTFLRGLANDGVQGPSVANYLKTTLGDKKICVVDDSTDYGSGLAKAVRATLGPVADEACNISVKKGDKDFSAAVTQVKGQSPAAPRTRSSSSRQALPPRVPCCPARAVRPRRNSPRRTPRSSVRLPVPTAPRDMTWAPSWPRASTPVRSPGKRCLPSPRPTRDRVWLASTSGPTPASSPRP